MNQRDIKQAIRNGRIDESAVELALRHDSPLTADLRLMTASGLLKKDPATARLILRRIDLEELAAAIRTDTMRPDMITLATKIWRRSRILIASVYDSPLAPVSALAAILPALSDQQLEALAKDTVRLLLAPDLMEALLKTGRLDPETAEQVEMLQKKHAEDEELRLREEYKPENLEEKEKELLIEESEDDEDGLEEESLRDSVNIYTKLKDMTVAEKAMLAMKGNKNVRMLLVKDNNRMVARSVMRSPRLTEQDVETIAKTREVDEEILRNISSNKRWLRRYSIMKNLAFNPRTPLAVSMSLSERLSNNDIKSGARDHNIPAALRQFIAKVAQKRGIR